MICKRTVWKLGPAGLLAATTVARAQSFTIDWFTIDCGGSGPNGALQGGTAFTLSSTIGQPDAGLLSGGAFSIDGGFWAAVSATCYANCDGSTAMPVLNVNDFLCFLNTFAANDQTANCDLSTTQPILNINDFTCFLNTFAAGCS